MTRLMRVVAEAGQPRPSGGPKGPPLLVVMVVAAIVIGSSGSARSQAPSGQQAPVVNNRARFLEMFARAYFPGRTGQLLIVPRQGDIITRDEPAVVFMHGSPWPYDTRIPMMFAGPQVLTGTSSAPARQQDVAPTLAAVLGAAMPRSTTGRVLPILRSTVTKPRAVLLVVLDGMRLDYFDRYAGELPMLSSIRKRSAWFTNARVDYIPSNTAVGHTTVSTGTDPGVHGITGNNLFDRTARARYDNYAGWQPQDLMALTLGDVWQLQTSGRGLVIAQGSSTHAATALGGHGACQLNGTRTVLAGYNERTGAWDSNEKCFVLPPQLRDLNAKTLWGADGLWMGHKVDSTSAVRRSGLFPGFEAQAFQRMIEAFPVGEDEIPDLLLLNFKAADYVGHQFGPDSPELKATLGEMDRHLAQILKLVDSRTKGNYLVAFTADHGMPTEPPTPGRRHVATSIVERIHERFDPERRALISYYEPENQQLFVDQERLTTLGLTLKQLATFLESQPFVFATFTEDEVRARAASLNRR
jgi:hypothetical protein